MRGGGGGGGGGERERERERREETVMKLQLATPKRVNTNARRCCHATIGVYACNHSFTPSFLPAFLPSFLVAKFMMAIKFAFFHVSCFCLAFTCFLHFSSLWSSDLSSMLGYYTVCSSSIQFNSIQFNSIPLRPGMMAASPTSTFVPTNLITIIIILFKPWTPPQPSNLNTYSAMATPPN